MFDVARMRRSRSVRSREEQARVAAEPGYETEKAVAKSSTLILLALGVVGVLILAGDD